MDTVLECRNLGKALNRIPIIKNISLNLHRGTAMGLFGRAGSGKTALVKLICGMLTPTIGSILVYGEEIGVESKAQTACAHSGGILDPARKPRELAGLYAALFADFNSETALGMLADMNIPVEEKLSTRSPEDMRKTQLALVLSRDARLFLLDEPFAGFDAQTVSYLSGVIASKKSEKNALIILSRDIQSVEPLTDVYAFMREGELVCRTDREELAKTPEKTLADLYQEVCPC